MSHLIGTLKLAINDESPLLEVQGYKVEIKDGRGNLLNRKGKTPNSLALRDENGGPKCSRKETLDMKWKYDSRS